MSFSSIPNYPHICLSPSPLAPAYTSPHPHSITANVKTINEIVEGKLYQHCTQNTPMTHTHTHPFNGPFSRTTRVSRYQKGKTNLILLKQETVSGSGISWAICKFAPSSRQVTMPAPHHSGFYRPDALPATQSTVGWQERHP